MAEAMRLDRFLWFVRIAKKRDWAKQLAEAGHLRIDGRAVGQAHAAVRPGNILTLADHRGQVRAIRVLALPLRRGPPAEARGCYDELTTANVSQQGPRN